MPSSPLLEFWYAALREPIGYVLKIVIGDKTLAIQKLYAARRAAADSDLAGISIVQSPTEPDELWLVKKEPSLVDPEGS